MKLTKEHRETFIYILDDAIKEYDLRQKLAEDRKGAIWEVRAYLAKQYVELIRKALIDNEIDY